MNFRDLVTRFKARGLHVRETPTLVAVAPRDLVTHSDKAALREARVEDTSDTLGSQSSNVAAPS